MQLFQISRCILPRKKNKTHTAEGEKEAKKTETKFMQTQHAHIELTYDCFEIRSKFALMLIVIYQME